MNPVVVILVAGFEIPVEQCRLPNAVGEPCKAKVSDMAEHMKWHKRQDDGPKIIRYCRAGQHEYLKSAAAPVTISCQAHTPKEPMTGKQSKRMLSTGMEKTDNIRAA